jgi:hypothetical protein
MEAEAEPLGSLRIEARNNANQGRYIVTGIVPNPMGNSQVCNFLCPLSKVTAKLFCIKQNAIYWDLAKEVLAKQMGAEDNIGTTFIKRVCPQCYLMAKL